MGKLKAPSVQSELEGNTSTRTPRCASIGPPKLHSTPAVELDGDVIEILDGVVKANLQQSTMLCFKTGGKIDSLIFRGVADNLGLITLIPIS